MTTAPHTHGCMHAQVYAHTGARTHARRPLGDGGRLCTCSRRHTGAPSACTCKKLSPSPREARAHPLAGPEVSHELAICLFLTPLLPDKVKGNHGFLLGVELSTLLSHRPP